LGKELVAILGDERCPGFADHPKLPSGKLHQNPVIAPGSWALDELDFRSGQGITGIRQSDAAGNRTGCIVGITWARLYPLWPAHEHPRLRGRSAGSSTTSACVSRSRASLRPRARSTASPSRGGLGRAGKLGLTETAWAGGRCCQNRDRSARNRPAPARSACQPRHTPTDGSAPRQVVLRTPPPVEVTDSIKQPGGSWAEFGRSTLKRK